MIHHFKFKSSVNIFKCYFFYTFFLGILILTIAFLCGKNKDLKYRQKVDFQNTTSLCIDEDGRLYTFPFKIKILQLNPTSVKLSFEDKEGTIYQTISVNHPIYYKTYDVYLQSMSPHQITLLYYRQHYQILFKLGIALLFSALALLLISIIQSVKYKGLIKMDIWGNIVGTMMLILLLGLIIYGFKLGYPPFRTMSQTRLWYAFFILLIGWCSYQLIHLKILLVLSLLMGSVFVGIGCFNLEYHTQVLPPALQAIWFVPHVVSYMMAYAFLTIILILFLIKIFNKSQSVKIRDYWLSYLIEITFVLLGLGLLLGSIWAKMAWGDFWTWDIKEIWALITWMIVFAVLWIRTFFNTKIILSFIGIILAYIAIQITWFGVQYFPAASESLHLY